MKNYIINHGFFFDLAAISPQNYFEICNGSVVSSIKRLIAYYKENQTFLRLNETRFCPLNEMMDVAKWEAKIQEYERAAAAEPHKNKTTKKRSVDYNEKMLINIINLYAERNIQVFFLTVPVHKFVIQNLDAAQLHETFAYMEHLAQQYDNVTYENFLFEYQDKAEYFYDADHLNSAGARVFSEQIREILRRRGIFNAD